MGTFVPTSLGGWQPDLPDYRDYSPQSPEVMELFDGLELPTAEDVPEVDLREFFPGVRPRGDLSLRDSCAQACVSLLQYYWQRAIGKNLEPSTLFLAQVAARMGSADWGGLGLRAHLRAIVTFGLPPDRLWPSEPSNAQREPDAALFSFAPMYRSLRYLRLDGRNVSGRETLDNVKSFLAAGYPSVFGLSVPSTLSSESDIPYHPRYSFVRGGEALVAVGYDDQRLRGTRGALLVRSCWGESWGESGYGWLPYAFVEEQLANCFWTIIARNWLESAEFQVPRVISLRMTSSPR
jgi:hypothetical protein